MVYCVVPRDLGHKFAETLSRFYRDDPLVEVTIERRARDRRRTGDRRRGIATRSRRERRTIMSPNGRRIEERRAMTVPVPAPELPRRARRHEEQLVFIERLELPAQHVEDIDTARLVTRFQAGEGDVFKELYLRYFDRVYTYLRMALRDTHEAEDAAQDIFIQALEGLPNYELRAVPFRGWLFRLVRNHSVNLGLKRKRVDVEDPEAIERRRDGADDNEISIIDWLSDQDLMMLVERLPLAQRQVVALRYMLDLSSPEVAQVMDRSPEAVRQLHQRAIGFLQERLVALGRVPRHSGRHHMSRTGQPGPVLRARRLALKP